MSDQDLFIVKGFVALITTILLIIHTIKVWDTPVSLGRRLRYYALLGWCFLATTATVEQLHERVSFETRNVGAAVMIAISFAAAVVSLYEDRQQ